MAEEPKPDDIKDILADLDAILSGLNPAPKTASGQPSSPPAPSVPPPSPMDASPGLTVSKDVVGPPASAKPKPPEAKKPEPQAPPKPPATSVPPSVAHNPSSEGEPSIGKALPPLPAKPISSEPPAMTPASTKVTGSPFTPPKPATPPPASSTMPPVQKIPPVGGVVPGAQKPSAGPKGAFEIQPPTTIPPGISKDQIRQVAFLYMAGQDAKFQEFLQFLDSVALNVSKKPLYIQKSIIVKINPEGGDFQGILEKVKGAQAVGVVGILQGLPWAKLKDLQDVFKNGEIFFRNVEGEDILKRSAIVDLVVELMLLGPG